MNKRYIISCFNPTERNRFIFTKTNSILQAYRIIENLNKYEYWIDATIIDLLDEENNYILGYN